LVIFKETFQQMRPIPVIILLTLTLFLTPSLWAQEKQHASVTMKTVPTLDVATIERITGLKGSTNHGEYKITIPQNDLTIVVDSFRIIPPMGLGTWTAFTPSPKGAW
jgi:hypothetical protein